MFKDKSSFEYLIPPRGANKRASPVRPRCPIPVSRRNLDERRARKSARIRFNVGGSSLHERHEEDSSSAVYFLSFLFFSFFLRHSRLGDGVKIQRVQLVAGGSPTGSLNMRDLVAETLLSSSVLLHVRW